MGLLILFLFIIIDDLYFFTLVFVFCFFEIFLFPLQFFSSWLFLIPNHSLLFLSLILLYFGATFNRPTQLQIQKTKTFRKQQLQAPGHPEPLLPHKTHIFYFREHVQEAVGYCCWLYCSCPHFAGVKLNTCVQNLKLFLNYHIFHSLWSYCCHVGFY